MKKSTLFFVSAFLVIFLSACQKDDNMVMDDDIQPNPELRHGFGASGEEDGSDVPQDIFFGNGQVPSSHDITEFLPPIGDQGNYGTCVAWALGYNLKTAIEAMDNNRTSQDLVSPNAQFSAKDLFLSIPNNFKNPNCTGTSLMAAFDVMQQRGVATANTAPYNNLGDCSQGVPSSWDQEASNFKIDNYRSVNIDVQSIKQYIAQNRPVGFGAKLADNFHGWNSDDVLNGHTTFDRVGIHAYHAMTVVGYDDNKGPNGAFRVVNSWGEDWCDRGFIWIDYNFFVSPDFAFVAYVAKNSASDFDPNDDTDPAPGPNGNGNTDMIPWGLSDMPDQQSGGLNRILSYNVYNDGTGAARASSDWSVVYLYYNAFDANDYGILLYDYYSDDLGNPGENGDMGSGPGSSGNWWNHVDVPAGSNIAQAVSGSSENITWGYELPDLNGYYYLVMIADPFNSLAETDESNNYYYMTDSNGYPIWFDNGVPAGFTQESNTRNNHPGEEVEAHLSPGERNADLSNAYSKEEIRQMLIQLKKNGQLEEAVKTKFKKQIR